MVLEAPLPPLSPGGPRCCAGRRTGEMTDTGEGWGPDAGGPGFSVSH